MNTYRGRRVVSECGGYVTYVPVDPKTELPEYNEKSAEQYLAKGERMKPHLARDEHFRTLKNLVYGTRTRRAIARLRSYAIRGRVTAEVRLLDDGALAALARVKLYNSLFGLPHDLFKEVVSKL